MADQNNYKVPACMLDAARKTRQLMIDGQMIGISKLDVVISEVLKLNLKDELEIKNELLKRIKIHNYIPSSSEIKYMEAIFNEYKSITNKETKNDQD